MHRIQEIKYRIHIKIYRNICANLLKKNEIFSAFEYKVTFGNKIKLP